MSPLRTCPCDRGGGGTPILIGQIDPIRLDKLADKPPEDNDDRERYPSLSVVTEVVSYRALVNVSGLVFPPASDVENYEPLSRARARVHHLVPRDLRQLYLHLRAISIM